VHPLPPASPPPLPPAPPPTWKRSSAQASSPSATPRSIARKTLERLGGFIGGLRWYADGSEAASWPFRTAPARPEVMAF